MSENFNENMSENMDGNMNINTDVMSDYNNIYNTQEDITVSFWEQFPLSFMPNKYSKLVYATKGKMIGFVTLFMFIVTIILAGNFYLVSVPKMNEFFAQCPEFSLYNGVLDLEKDYELADEDMYIYISDSLDEVSLADAQGIQETDHYKQMVLISKNNLVFYNDGQYQTAKFSDFAGFNIDRDFVVNKLANMIYAIVGAGFVCYFIFGTLFYFFYALCYWLVMLVCCNIFKRNIDNGQLYKACVYGKVIMVTVATFVSILPISFTIPTYGRTMITLAILVFSLTKLPQKEA